MVVLQRSEWMKLYGPDSSIPGATIVLRSAHGFFGACAIKGPWSTTPACLAGKAAHVKVVTAALNPVRNSHFRSRHSSCGEHGLVLVVIRGVSHLSWIGAS
jgi:hypothetical protein